MRLVLASSALSLLTLAGALAQLMEKPNTPTLPIGDPDFAAAGMKTRAPGAPAQYHASLLDQVFVIQATLGNAAVLDLERLAEHKARSDAAREFTRVAIRDHLQADDSLSKLAKERGIYVPDRLDADHHRVRNALDGLDGPEFDIEYLRVQIQHHQRLAQLMEYGIGSGADAKIQRFASNTLPWIFTHLAMARDLLDKVSIQNPEIAAGPPKVSGMPTAQTPLSN
jgi:putative membrane protein